MKLYTDSLHKIAYSTDASVYREIPYGVAYPETEEDVRELMRLAKEKGVDLIPRAGGTSLAGQVVGAGIVVDISRHWNKILEINAEERWARVQPGVVRDELNMALKPYGLFFSPETSTSNRCCIGGMFGNNSCGTHSLVYGSTRQHVVAARGILTDGTLETFKDYKIAELEERFGEKFWKKKEHGALIERIYAQLLNYAFDEKTRRVIAEGYPDKELKRRSCGYAIDEVIEGLCLQSLEASPTINLCKLLAGSEGTLAFITEITVSLDVLPPKEIMVVCGHCDALEKSFEANLISLHHVVSEASQLHWERGRPRPQTHSDAGEASQLLWERGRPRPQTHSDAGEDARAPMQSLEASPTTGVTAVELMDGDILELSKGNVEQQKNRFFVDGDPAALLITELRAETREELDKKAAVLEHDLLNSGLVYKCTRVYGADVAKVWNLRKAGLGILGGMKGDAKPMGVIEDTAVAPHRLPAYMKDFRELLDRLGAQCVFYGHISTGELHLRPILNLKTHEGRTLFRTLAQETALLVKKHRGSISGEHGDGRLRGEFIPLLYGEEAYELMRQVKQCWDPDGLLNRHKIVDTLPMDSMLRFEEDHRQRTTDLRPQASDLRLQTSDDRLQTSDLRLQTSDDRLQTSDDRLQTYFNWKAAFDECTAPGATGARSQTHALICSIEQCNGSGDCRKSNVIGGTMCPAYKVSGDELKTTRARANVLREVLTRGANSQSSIFNFQLIKEVLDSCLACKGCRSECPSNVDMTRLRAEMLQQYYDRQGTPLRSWMVARMAQMEEMGRMVRPLYNFAATWKPSAAVIKRVVRFAPERNIPTLSKRTMKQLVAESLRAGTGPAPTPRAGTGPAPTTQPRRVYIFADEFTNQQEAELGLTFAKLLMRLGYQVEIPDLLESGRAAISKGCLKRAKIIAQENVKRLSSTFNVQCSTFNLVGIEPSAILTFRDEYPDLVPAEMRKEAQTIGKRCLLYDEFLKQEIDNGHISAEAFKADEMEIWLHGHCHQKALVGVEMTVAVLQSLLKGATVHTIPSGCCGMAGSFGYEKEHYKTSLEIGEMVLFPTIRKIENERLKVEQSVPAFVAAPGTSCRQQILDGTGVRAVHPIEILYKYLT